MMNLKEQEYIYTIARNRSITKASKELHITQSALSLFVQNVEKQMGIQLFERYKKEMIPTYYGELYLLYADRILREGKEFNQKLQSVIDKKEGRIRFGINSRRSPYIVPGLLVKMKKLYPNVEVIVKESDTISLTSLLLNNELDCIYSYEKISNRNIISELLLGDRIGMAIGKSHPQRKNIFYDKSIKTYWIDSKCLDKETFLLYENDETRICFDNWMTEAGIHASVQEYYNVETMLALAEIGYGIPYLNEMYVKNYNKNWKKESTLEFVLANQQKDKIEVYFSYHIRLLENEYGKEFTDIIKNMQI